MQFNEKYEKQMISVDVSIFAIINNQLNVLLVKREKEPHENMWSLIGGGVYNNETCENAVKRELEEKVGITNINPVLSGVFSEPNRDVRFRNISISYYCLTTSDSLSLGETLNKVSDIKWFPVSEVPELAFDHKDILNQSIEKLKSKAYDIEFIRPHLPETFTLGSLQTIFESILGTSLDKRNFRRKLNSMNCLESTGLKNELDTHKKSDIFKFKK